MQSKHMHVQFKRPGGGAVEFPVTASGHPADALDGLRRDLGIRRHATMMLFSIEPEVRPINLTATWADNLPTGDDDHTEQVFVMVDGDWSTRSGHQLSKDSYVVLDGRYGRVQSLDWLQGRGAYVTGYFLAVPDCQVVDLRMASRLPEAFCAPLLSVEAVEPIVQRVSEQKVSEFLGGLKGVSPAWDYVPGISIGRRHIGMYGVPIMSIKRPFLTSVDDILFSTAKEDFETVRANKAIIDKAVEIAGKALAVFAVEQSDLSNLPAFYQAVLSTAVQRLIDADKGKLAAELELAARPIVDGMMAYYVREDQR